MVNKTAFYNDRLPEKERKYKTLRAKGLCYYAVIDS